MEDEDLADDVLEVDSPEHEVVDDIDELDDEILLPVSEINDGDSGSAAGHASTFNGQSGSLSKLYRPKEKPRKDQLQDQKSLPYAVESLDEMDAKLEEIIRRLIDCVIAKDYDVGLMMWNHRLECWMSLKYPMKRELRAKLARLYFELSVLPGMDARLVDMCTAQFVILVEPKKRIDISDMQLPWRPIYAVLEKELFPKQRKTGLTNVFSHLLSLTEFSQRFFPPHEIPAMLKTFLPRLSASLNSILAAQAFCTHFLPLSHPQYYLAALFKLWEAFNSSIWDEQWLDIMLRLSSQHLDPGKSHPDIVEELRELARQRGEEVNETEKVEELDVGDGPQSQKPGTHEDWNGIRKDVGIFTEAQWAFIMTKCLRNLSIPIATTLATARPDEKATGVALTMKRPSDKLYSFAGVIVFSISADASPSGATPLSSGLPSRSPSGANLHTSVGDKLTVKAKTYLAGSKSLDSLAKLIQATESFFHPSNYGPWAPQLAKFLAHLTTWYHQRVKDEAKKDCKVPLAWRLNPAIQHHFVSTLRTVALMSMFSRDPMTIAHAHTALQTMAFLEPDLIFPAILERAFPALEAVLETHRTVSIITALSAVAPPLMSRQNYPAGAKHLLPLLELSLPGLDVNDPIKTVSTAMFILQAVSSIMIDDLTRPEVQSSDVPVYEDLAVPKISISDDVEPHISRAEEDDAVRASTAGFPDWVANFFRQVLVVFEALPEPGRNQRSGGKAEEQMSQLLTAACDYVCGHMSPPLFDLALDIVFRHVTTSIRSNSSRVVSALVKCFARANSAKTLAKFLPICVTNIRQEIESGASSVRTTSSSSNIESDVTLHWWIGLLSGALERAGPNLLVYRNEIIPLLETMMDSCKGEHGYTSSGRVVTLILAGLTEVYIKDSRVVNPEEWESDDWQKHHHERWGKQYTADEVKVAWHTPHEEEIDLALEILRTLIVPAVERLETLLQESALGSSKLEWTNDFCRFCNMTRAALCGIANIVRLPPPANPGQLASDVGEDVPEFISYVPNYASGFALDDGADARFVFVTKLRERIGWLLHSAVQSLKDNGAEDSIDCVKIIVSTIRVLELDYPHERTAYVAAKRSYEFALSLSRSTEHQKMNPRFVWVRRAVLHHASRMRLNSFYRKRSVLDDHLIADLATLSLSNYVQVRKSAQKGLDQMCQNYDGLRTLLFADLFKALNPGTHHDTMKGALYVLGSKPFQNLAIRDWRYGPQYLEALFGCSHQERPSVQNLVKQIIHDFVIRLAEPSTLKGTVTSSNLKEAAKQLEQSINFPADSDLSSKVVAIASNRIIQQNIAYDKLLPSLLSLAQSPVTHWRYSLSAIRFLRALIRRDQPQRVDLSVYLAHQIISDLPNQRTHGMLALTKILHFIKLRTASNGSDERLLLQQTTNPLRRKVTLDKPLPADFTEKFINSFSQKIGKDTLLMDKQSTGWLVWGDSVEFYAVPSESESAISWDSTSKETIEALRNIFLSGSWWDTFGKHLSQEKAVDYLAADIIKLVKSIFQVYEDAPCEFVLPLIDGLLVDKDDRHKQRAAGELIGGMVRGSKHWPLKKQNRMWNWLTPLLPSIIDGITPETQIVWEMCVEYILASRDPRRNQPLVDYVTSLEIDPDSSEAFGNAKRQEVVCVTMKALGWHFSPWSAKYIKMYSSQLDHPFSEVRSVVAENLKQLCELRLHPSYSSVEAFLSDAGRFSDEHGLLTPSKEYNDIIDGFKDKLIALREKRLPSALGTQDYDKAALTLVSLVYASTTDHLITPLFPFVIRLLPEFFRMIEIQDNPELHISATRNILALSSTQYPAALAKQLLQQYIALLRESESWRVRLDVLAPLGVFYFCNIYFLDDEIVAELMDQLCDLLRDPKIEVRQRAADILSSIVKCSQRSSVVSLSKRFMKVLRATKIPKRRNSKGVEVAGYQEALTHAHSAVLGVTSLVKAFPYEVPAFIPSILIECMSMHATSPVPISTTVKVCLADFKLSHTDSWEEDKKAFTEEQLSALHDLLTGSSYYA